jgi:hypothetical protein
LKIFRYGRNVDIAGLDRRKKGPGGNIQHAEAVAVQKMKKKEEARGGRLF